MGLFVATIKTGKLSNGIKLEKGMSVDFVSQSVTPLNSNGGKEVVDAFMRKYGIDIKKAGAVSSTYIDIQKVQ
jgi:hypothetical protein